MLARVRSFAPLPLLFVVLASPAAGQARGNSSLTGTVTGAGRPLPGALIVRRGIIRSDTMRADSLGHYEVRGLPVGRHVFVVSQRGFEPIEMEVTFTSDTSLTADIPLEPRAGAAADGGGSLEHVGFVRRRRESEAAHERVTFLGPEEIAARAAARVNLLFDGVHDVTVRHERGIAVLYGYDGRCVMNVWIDGLQVNNAFPPAGGQVASGRTSGTDHYTGLDDMIPLNQIAGIEIYPRPAATPQQFQVRAGQIAPGRALAGARAIDLDTRTADCGTIVIWSKR